MQKTEQLVKLRVCIPFRKSDYIRPTPFKIARISKEEYTKKLKDSKLVDGIYIIFDEEFPFELAKTVQIYNGLANHLNILEDRELHQMDDDIARGFMHRAQAKYFFGASLKGYNNSLNSGFAGFKGTDEMLNVGDIIEVSEQDAKILTMTRDTGVHKTDHKDLYLPHYTASYAINTRLPRVRKPIVRCERV